MKRENIGIYQIVGKKKKKKFIADLLYKTCLDFTRESAKLKGVLILMSDSNVFFFLGTRYGRPFSKIFVMIYEK